MTDTNREARELEARAAEFRADAHRMAIEAGAIEAYLEEEAKLAQQTSAPGIEVLAHRIAERERLLAEATEAGRAALSRGDLQEARKIYRTVVKAILHQAHDMEAAAAQHAPAGTIQ